MGMAPEDFRALMRNHAGAVTVIAVGKSGTRTGLTATAVCSLSDDPARILICVNRSASAHDPIESLRCFSVNLLAIDQADVANRFAGRAGLEGEDRFADPDWMTLKTGAPILVHALASLDCEVAEHQHMETHSIFIANVRDGRSRGNVAPLVYFDGRFCALASDASEPVV
jgi:flavin reductase (NADH)/cob(II)yrinic acid a,c-diamide reductase